MDSKKFLYAFRDRYYEIDAADDMVQTLLQRSKTPSARNDNPKVRTSNALVDKMSMYVNQLDAARARLQKLVEQQNRDREIIERALERLRPAIQRDVIRYRYLMCLKWDDVNQHMHGHLDDFEDREESYLRRATKAHGAALKKLDTIIEELLEQETGTGETAAQVNAAVE